MIINTNMSSLNTQNFLRMNNASLETSMSRLSSGKRINSAGDDAAGLAISTRMEAAIRGMDVAKRNAMDGISLIQTAESAMGSITSLLQRMRELAVQADNGTNGTADRTSLQNEATALAKEIGHIAKNTTFNANQLIDVAGPATPIKLHISNLSGDTIDVKRFDVTETTLNVEDLQFDTSAEAQQAIVDIDKALDDVSGFRADLGATQSRLNFIIDNLNVTSNNLTSAKSRIVDADMAVEMSNLTKTRVISQSAMAMLAQANAQPQSILQLLQG